MLEKLTDKFIDERTVPEKEEMNEEHGPDLLIQDITAQIEQTKQDRSEKVETKAKKFQAKADAARDLTDNHNS